MGACLLRDIPFNAMYFSSYAALKVLRRGSGGSGGRNERDRSALLLSLPRSLTRPLSPLRAIMHRTTSSPLTAAPSRPSLS